MYHQNALILHLYTLRDLGNGQSAFFLDLRIIWLRASLDSSQLKDYDQGLKLYIIQLNVIYIRGNRGGVKISNQKRHLLNSPSRTPRIIPKRF